jgi:glutaredoxin
MIDKATININFTNTDIDTLVYAVEQLKVDILTRRLDDELDVKMKLKVLHDIEQVKKKMLVYEKYKNLKCGMIGGCRQKKEAEKVVFSDEPDFELDWSDDPEDTEDNEEYRNAK